MEQEVVVVVEAEEALAAVQVMVEDLELEVV